MLRERLSKHGVPVWLVNTGWTGCAYGVGKRMSLAHTRAILKAVLEGALTAAPFVTDPIFGVDVPQQVPGVPSAVFQPRGAWADPAAYDVAAKKLAEIATAAFQAKR